MWSLLYLQIKTSLGWFLGSWDSAQVGGRWNHTLIDIAGLVLSLHSYQGFVARSHWYHRVIHRLYKTSSDLVLLQFAHLLNELEVLGLQIWIARSVSLLLLVLNVKRVVIVGALREVSSQHHAVAVSVVQMSVNHIDAAVIRTLTRVSAHTCLHSLLNSN